MKRALSVVIASVSLIALTSTSDAKSKKMDAAKAAMVEAFKKAGTPGPGHKRLAMLVGNWKVKATVWPGPGAPPQRSTGKSSAKLILGKRFVQQTYRGTFMGKPFNGLGMVGFDNITGKYVSTWADSMSTTLMTSEGTIDEAGKVITYDARYSCPIINGPKKAKVIIRLLGKRST